MNKLSIMETPRNYLTDEINIIKKLYPKFGAKYCVSVVKNILGYYRPLEAKAKSLGLVYNTTHISVLQLLFDDWMTVNTNISDSEIVGAIKFREYLEGNI
jgi:hypothetical protein